MIVVWIWFDSSSNSSFEENSICLLNYCNEDESELLTMIFRCVSWSRSKTNIKVSGV